MLKKFNENVDDNKMLLVTSSDPFSGIDKYYMSVTDAKTFFDRVPLNMVDKSDIDLLFIYCDDVILLFSKETQQRTNKVCIKPKKGIDMIDFSIMFANLQPKNFGRLKKDWIFMFIN